LDAPAPQEKTIMRMKNKEGFIPTREGHKNRAHYCGRYEEEGTKI
jgi:hypothetical protein